MKSTIFAIAACGVILLSACNENKTNKRIITREDIPDSLMLNIDDIPSVDLSCDTTNTANLSIDSITVKDFDKTFTFKWEGNGKEQYAQHLIMLAIPTEMPNFDIKGLMGDIIKAVFNRSYNSIEQAYASLRTYEGKANSKLINALPDGINLNEVEQKGTNGTLLDLYYDIICYQLKFTAQKGENFSEETKILNYDLQQGRLLTFDDFFRADKKAALIEEITKHTKGAKYTFDKTKAPSNIFFQNNTANFIYNQSEVNSPDGIAPYITIPLSILKPYMTDFAIQRLKP